MTSDIQNAVNEIKELCFSQGCFQDKEMEKEVEKVIGKILNVGEEMTNDILFYQCLLNAGVDNWEGYSEAWREFEEITNEGEHSTE